MGCDIHLKLERRMVKPLPNLKDKLDEKGKFIGFELDNDNKWAKYYYEKLMSEWMPCEFTQNDCWGDRCYGMFARLADVRNYWDDVKSLPVRGFPTDAHPTTLRAYTYELVPDDEFEKNEERYDEWDDAYINESTGNEWVEKGYSTVMGKSWSDRILISGPDWHSASWCTTKELKKCVRDNFYDKEFGWHGEFVEWLSLVGAMEAIEKTGYYKCRAVFWFDN
jgi:hypothetical protein